MPLLPTPTEPALAGTTDRGQADADVLARHRLVDALVAVVAVVAGFVVLRFDLGERGSSATVVSYLLVLAGGLVLMARRRQALLVLAAVGAARVLVAWEAGNEHALLLAAAIALYTAARTGPRRHRLSIAVVAAAAMAMSVAGFGDDGFLSELLPEVTLLLLAVAIADGASSRAERIAGRIESEAASRVQAERLRIARDLHDVVAHSLSTIAVQSGVAAHLIDRDPGQAKEAIEIINRTGRASLEELRAMVGVLRSTDEAPLRPTPTDPDDLDALLAGATDAGLEVATTIEGAFPDDAGERCVVTVHRIIQEALTNVVRHAGPVPTELVIRHGIDAVVVTVSNGAGLEPTGRAASTGVGIVGMVERAESLGGALTAGPSADGGFQVSATLPYLHRRSGTSAP